MSEAQSGVGEIETDGVGQPGRVGLDDDAVEPVPHDFRDAAAPGPDHRQSVGEGVEHGPREVVVPDTRHGHEVSIAQQLLLRVAAHHAVVAHAPAPSLAEGDELLLHRAHAPEVELEIPVLSRRPTPLW